MKNTPPSPEDPEITIKQMLEDHPSLVAVETKYRAYGEPYDANKVAISVNHVLDMEFDGSQVEYVGSKAELLKIMEEIRRKNDGSMIEPIGYVIENNDGTFEIHYYQDSLETSERTREKMQQRFLHGQKVTWHGHPSFDLNSLITERHRTHPISGSIEDGNLNKPSFPDLFSDVTQFIKTTYIAVPNGTIEINKTGHPLLLKLQNWFNTLGTQTDMPQELLLHFAKTAFYTLMRKAGIEKYTAQTWQQLYSALGFDVTFHPEAEQNKAVRTKANIEKADMLLAYFNSESFKTDNLRDLKMYE